MRSDINCGTRSPPLPLEIDPLAIGFVFAVFTKDFVPLNLVSSSITADVDPDADDKDDANAEVEDNDCNKDGEKVVHAVTVDVASFIINGVLRLGFVGKHCNTFDDAVVIVDDVDVTDNDDIRIVEGNRVSAVIAFDSFDVSLVDCILNGTGIDILSIKGVVVGITDTVVVAAVVVVIVVVAVVIKFWVVTEDTFVVFNNLSGLFKTSPTIFDAAFSSI